MRCVGYDTTSTVLFSMAFIFYSDAHSWGVGGNVRHSSFSVARQMPGLTEEQLKRWENNTNQRITINVDFIFTSLLCLRVPSHIWRIYNAHISLIFLFATYLIIFRICNSYAIRRIISKRFHYLVYMIIQQLYTLIYFYIKNICITINSVTIYIYIYIYIYI